MGVLYGNALATHLQNGGRSQKTAVTVPASRLNQALLTALQEQRLIRQWSYTNTERDLRVELAYQHQQPVLRRLEFKVAKRSRTHYSVAQLAQLVQAQGAATPTGRVRLQPQLYFLSTSSHGILTAQQCLQQRVGGQLLLVATL